MDLKNWNDYTTIGVIGTVLFHGVIVVLLVIFGFTTPLPLPSEKGVMINLGVSDQGMGVIQPEQAAQSASSASSSSGQNEEAVTQNTEESVALSQSSRGQDNQQDAQNNSQSSNTNEPDPVNPNLTYEQRQNADGGNEGETGESGDQGNPDGNRNAGNYDGTPGGGGTEGISYSLGNRGHTYLHKPQINPQETGKVVVKIWVDRDGNVKRAEPGQQGSTTTNTQLYRVAKEAAMQTTFTSKSDAAELQYGTITYVFRVR